MSDGLFDFVIKLCTVGSFILFSLLGICFTLISVFRIFSQFLNKILVNSTVNIDCNDKKSETKIYKKIRNVNSKRVKEVKST